MLLPNVYRLGHSLGYGIQTWMKHPQLDGLFSNFSWEWIRHLPVGYKDWWLNAATNDPIHVIVETSLLAFVVYLLILTRNKDYKFRKEQKLTSKEQEDLLEEWKNRGRASLAPSPSQMSSLFTAATATTSVPIVSSMNGRTMEILVPSKDNDHDADDKENTIMNHAIISSVFKKKKSRKESQMKKSPSSTSCSNEDEKSSNSSEEENISLSSGVRKQTVLNFATNDFLGFASSSEVKDASLAALKKYGCGSCGPRGFYGTIDVHLELEAQMASYVGTEQAILYSDGASAVSSTIAAFCKRGDLIIVDEGVYEPIVTGVTLSRANVIWFKHNDMEDLKRVLKQVEQKDKKLGRASNDQRRFIVVEGLYKNSGTVCPLDKLVELKHEFKYRLILDETHSFGTLAPKGCLDFFSKRYMYDAEIVTIGLETTLAGIGGMTVGNEEVVDHQRLSGAGYCFSASSPPFTATAAMASLSLLMQETSLTKKLQSNLKYFHQQLSKSSILSSSFTRSSHENSPLIQLEFEADQDRADRLQWIQMIVEECLTNGVAFVASRRYNHAHQPPPALCMTVSCTHTHADIDQAISVLEQACESVSSKKQQEN